MVTFSPKMNGDRDVIQIYSSDGTGSLGKRSIVEYESHLTHRFASDA
jgi:hypothetical protein